MIWTTCDLTFSCQNQVSCGCEDPGSDEERLLPGLNALGLVLLLLVAAGQDGFLEEEVKLGSGGCGNMRLEKVAKIRLSSSETLSLILLCAEEQGGGQGSQLAAVLPPAGGSG